MHTLLINPKRRGLMGLAAITLITVCGLLLSAGQALAAHCAAPYVQVQGQGTAPPGGDPSGELQIQNINIGEPLITCDTRQLRIIIKVADMDPEDTGQVTPAPNTSWQAEFIIPGSANSSGQPQTIFVVFDTNQIPTGRFDYGFVDASPTGGGLYTSQCPTTGACPATGTVATNGTITITLDMTTPLSFSDINAVERFTMPALPPGTQLSSIAGNTYTCACAVGNGFLITQSSTAGDGAYTVMGNVSCSAPPVAALSANVTSGSAPLTVNFNASASSNTGGCGTLDSYIFDFGDGTQVTQTGPTVSHTYTAAGTYPARVRVVNTAGVTSSNLAQVNITVTGGGGPLLGSVVSRKTHGVTAFDILMPQSGTPAVECRTGGGSNNHTLIYTFVNNLTAVANATVTSGTGSVASRTLGPSAKQYTVNLTGVTNAQRVTVTLQNAIDSTGANGSVPATMRVLLGDTSNSASVNSTDIGQTKSKSGQTTNSTNYRNDVTVSGSINASDIGQVKSKSGTSVP